jgi:hypothetical protein
VSVLRAKTNGAVFVVRDHSDDLQVVLAARGGQAMSKPSEEISLPELMNQNTLRRIRATWRLVMANGALVAADILLKMLGKG